MDLSTRPSAAHRYDVDNTNAAVAGMKMKKLNLYSIILAATVLTVAFQATAAIAQVSTQEFREKMMTWAAASEEAQYLPGSDLVAKLDGLTDEQMEIFLSMFEDPEQFLLSLEQAAVQLQNSVISALNTSEGWDSLPSTLAQQRSPMLA